MKPLQRYALLEGLAESEADPLSLDLASTRQHRSLTLALTPRGGPVPAPHVCRYRRRYRYLLRLRSSCHLRAPWIRSLQSSRGRRSVCTDPVP